MISSVRGSGDSKMRIGPDRKQHLTYCLNVHAGESWQENLDAIRKYACDVRDQVGVEEPFGLGLRLSAAAAEVLAAPAAIADFRGILDDLNLYVFTVNGFPYGTFHAAAVKEQVYAPDWRRPERVAYTNLLAHILAELLPDGVDGSISTAPGSYKAWVRTDEDRREIAENLLAVSCRLAQLADETGHEIHLGLEPEPDCLLETTDEVITFLSEDMARAMKPGGPVSEDVVRRHLGVCFDACHMALQFENPAESVRRLTNAGVRISKVQLSAALRARGGGSLKESLGAFADSVYLHQTRVKTEDGNIQRFSDLPQALAETDLVLDRESEWRVHCHVPLYWQGEAGITSTSHAMDDSFFAAVEESGCTHLEMETYTFDVLPLPLRQRGIVASLVDEYGWFSARVGCKGLREGTSRR